MFEERPQDARLNAAVRQFNAAWTLLEIALATYFGRLLLTDQFRARIVWNEMKSMQARLNLMNKLVFTYVDNPEKDLVAARLNEVERHKKLRNLLAHSMFFVDPKDFEQICFNNDHRYSKVGGVVFIKESRVALSELERDTKDLNDLMLFFGSHGNETTSEQELCLNCHTNWHREMAQPTSS